MSRPPCAVFPFQKGKRNTILLFLLFPFECPARSPETPEEKIPPSVFPRTFRKAPGSPKKIPQSSGQMQDRPYEKSTGWSYNAFSYPIPVQRIHFLPPRSGSGESLSFLSG